MRTNTIDTIKTTEISQKDIAIDDINDNSNEQSHNDTIAKAFNINFNGTTRQYFSLWYSNLFLTIISCGIFSPWAKVRKNRFFYGNTQINDANFEYDANPLNILIIRIILISILLASSYFVGADQNLQSIENICILLIIPFLIIRGLSFNARFSSYRQVRFKFEKHTLLLYLHILPFLIIAIFGLTILSSWNDLNIDINLPFDQSLQQLTIYTLLFLSVILFVLLVYLVRYFFYFKVQNHHWGSLNFQYKQPHLITMFSIYLTSLLLIFAGFFVISSSDIANLEVHHTLFIVWFILLFIIIKIYFSIAHFKIFWGNIFFEDGHFSVQFSIWKYITRVGLPNFFIILFSCGTLYPWTAIRRTRFLAKHVSIITTQKTLNSILQKNTLKENAMGDEFVADQGIDFDIGLVP